MATPKGTELVGENQEQGAFPPAEEMLAVSLIAEREGQFLKLCRKNRS